MSINSMTNQAIGRRPDFEPLGTVPKTYAGLARTSSAVNLPANTPENKVSTALSVLTTYIPTEVLTVYVAVLAAIQDPNRRPFSAQWVVFWAFFVATPAIVWLIYTAKVKSAGKAIILAPSGWPLWEMSAATLAFLAWAFALPNTPFMELAWYSAPLSGVTVLVTSTALGLLAPVVQVPLKF